jgi:hypothetical protein
MHVWSAPQTGNPPSGSDVTTSGPASGTYPPASGTYPPASGDVAHPSGGQHAYTAIAEQPPAEQHPLVGVQTSPAGHTLASPAQPSKHPGPFAVYSAHTWEAEHTGNVEPSLFPPPPLRGVDPSG